MVAGDPPFVTLTAVGRWAAAVAAEAAGREPRPRPGHPRSRPHALAPMGDFTPESYAATAINNDDSARSWATTRRADHRRARTGDAAASLPSRLAAARRRRRLRRAACSPTSPAAASRAGVPWRPTPTTSSRCRSPCPTCPARAWPSTRPQCRPVRASPGSTSSSRAPTSASTCAGRSTCRPPTDRGPAPSRRSRSTPGPRGRRWTSRSSCSTRSRPIQAARVLATVRATPARRDLVQVLAVSAHGARADPEARRHQRRHQPRRARRRLTNRRPTWTSRSESGAVADLLDDIEQRASRVLAGDETPVVDAPASERPRSSSTSPALGSQLHRKLADIDDPTARTLSLFVRYDTPILPLELAYAGPAPSAYGEAVPPRHPTPRRMDAALPRRRRRPVVCPYAFWGMHRTITRTIEGRRARLRRHAPLGTAPPAAGAVRRRRAGRPRPPAGTPEDDFPSRSSRTRCATRWASRWRG